jgi:hypothetical protein
LASGTLGAGNYFVYTTYQDSTGESAKSPEAQLNLAGPGTLIVAAPAAILNGNSPGWKIYIGSSSGTETLQSTQAGFGASYQQSAPLSGGASAPTTNTSACKLRFNDELVPSYTGYNVTMKTAAGTTVSGWPIKFYLSGGAAGTINLSNGLPLYSGVVTYPQPVVALPAAGGLQSINGPLSIAGFLASCIQNGMYVAGSTCYPQIQDTFTAACNVGGGFVWVPPGTYVRNTSFALCSNLHVLMGGSAQAEQVACPVTITSTLSSGDLFPFLNANDSSITDFCIKYTGSGANAAISLTSSQRINLARFYVSGPFAIGLLLKSSATANASTIWNDVRDFHCTGIAANGIGVKIDSADASAKVINGNTIWNDHCVGGTGGKGLWLTNTAGLQVINENVINCSECSAITGTAVLIDANSTKDLTLYNPNMEGSSIGFSKRTGNSVSIIGGNISSNGNNSLAVNVVDDQPAFTSFINTTIGGVVQQWSITPAGDLNANSLGANKSNCAQNTMCLNGYTFTALTNLAVTPPAGTISFCSDCTIANPCAGAGTGAFAKRLNGVWVCN